MNWIERISSFPASLVFILLIFIAQTTVFVLLMSFHANEGLFHPYLEIILAATIISTGLYILTIRKIHKNLIRHIQTEQSLRLSRQELETQVGQHTAELQVEVAERHKVERQLQLQDTAMRAAATGIVITDRNGYVQWSNPAFATMTGYSTDEVSGQNIRLLKSGQHGEDFYAELWSTILAGQVWRGDIVNKRKDGSHYTEEQTITPVVGSNGEITHFIAVKQDISEKHQVQAALEAERERLFTVLNGLPALVYLKDHNYKVRFANQQFRDQFGEPGDELCYRLIRQRNQPCEDCPTLTVFDGGKPHEWEWDLPDGRIYQLYDYPFIDIDGSQLVLQLGIDITERKRAESKLEQYNDELLALTQQERSQRHLAEGLFQATLAINASLNLDEVLEHILDQIQRALPYRAAAVMLKDEDTLYVVHQHGQKNDSASFKRESGVQVDQHPLYQFTSGVMKSTLINDRQLSSELTAGLGLEWVQSLITAPLTAEEDVFGIIALFDDQTGSFNQNMAERLDIFSVLALLAIKNARLFEQVRTGQSRMQALSHRLVEIQEKERRYIAQELHDETGQALTALMVGLKLIEQNVNEPSRILTETAGLKSTLDGVMENLHRLAIDLRPASLDHLGLVPALRHDSRTISEKYGIQVEFEALNVQQRLPADIEISIYRVTQEALANILRHAQATRVSVLLEVQDGKIVLIVEDNGVGFNPDSTHQSGRLGVIGMRERAEMLGGKLEIESSESVGTTVFLEVPYAN